MADSDDDPATPGTADGSTDAVAGESPQRDALRRQQRSVAVAGSVIAGLAVTVAVLQRYPELAPLGVGAGVVSGLAVYRLAARSIFPDESESDADPEPQGADEATVTDTTDGESPE